MLVHAQLLQRGEARCRETARPVLLHAQHAQHHRQRLQPRQRHVPQQRQHRRQRRVALAALRVADAHRQLLRAVQAGGLHLRQERAHVLRVAQHHLARTLRAARRRCTLQRHLQHAPSSHVQLLQRLLRLHRVVAHCHHHLLGAHAQTASVQRLRHALLHVRQLVEQRAGHAEHLAAQHER